MTIKNGLVSLFLLFCCFCYGQQDNVIPLQEIDLADFNLKKSSSTLFSSILTDSVVKNSTSLTSLLQNNSSIYFKENGAGMVSSASFRGTTAQQTAVIWNGININSQFNGQTDFNTIAAIDFDEVVVRHGGGSSLYGSSAIGGSIHLNTNLNFKPKVENSLRLRYGSFETVYTNYQLQYTKNKFSTQISISHTASQNDYPYLATTQKNENGAFRNTSYNLGLGYQLNSKNSLFYYSYLFHSDRDFSGTLVTTSKSNYKDFTARNLVEWNSNFSKFYSKLQVAFLSERFQYYEDKNFPIFEQAQAETTLAKYQLNRKIATHIEISTLIEATYTKGFGQSIGENERSIFSGVLVGKYSPIKKIVIEGNARQEITSNYNSPFLFSLGSSFVLSKQYTVKTNISRNYRIPTFNDLFYKGSGNANLKPENANQIEIGNTIKWNKKLQIDFVGYYIKIKDLLRWSPNANSGWSPNNVANVTSYGGELSLDYSIKSGRNNWKIKTNYAYTISEDDKIKKQLIYVPFHKTTTSIQYNKKAISINLNYIFNGSVFTTSDNNYFLSNYSIINGSLQYQLPFCTNCMLGCNVNNIFNENYQSVSQRPMPGRNYNFLITFKL